MTDFPAAKSFQYAAASLPYYQSIVAEKAVDATAITDQDTFEAHVPVLTKNDIFPRFSVSELCSADQLADMDSAIVTSGTSGVFAYGLVTKKGVAQQKQMVDQNLAQLFDLESREALIINMLPMGVSFVSEHPVVPVSTRTDIALEIIKTFGKGRQVIIVTDPRLLHKLLLEGVQTGMVWGEQRVSAIIGGMWSSDSYMQYVQALITAGVSAGESSNQVLITMGITEIGLNLFTATPDLIALRSRLQQQSELLQSLFGATSTCPTLAYMMSPGVYAEVLHKNDYGAGELTLTHLDQQVAPMLVRYNTGDVVKFLSTEELVTVGFVPPLPFPVVALYGRASDKEVSGFRTTDAQQILFANTARATQITGNYILTEKDGRPQVQYQLRPEVPLGAVTEMSGILLEPVAHEDFPENMGVQYEYKWKF